MSRCSLLSVGTAGGVTVDPGGAEGRSLGSGAVWGVPDGVLLLMEETWSVSWGKTDVLGLMEGICGPECVSEATVDVGGIGGMIRGVGGDVWGFGGVVWGFIGGKDVVMGGIKATIGGIRGVIWGIGGVEGISVVLQSIDGVVGFAWDFIGGSNGVVGIDVVLGGIAGVIGGIGGVVEGIDVLGGTDAALGGPGLSWCLSRWMKVSQVTASGPPSCLVLIRQLCRKLTGSSG